MTDEQRAAYVMAQSVCALGDILGMHAENQVRQFDNESPAFGHDEMSKVCEHYGIHHNAIVGFLTETK